MEVIGIPLLAHMPTQSSQYFHKIYHACSGRPTSKSVCILCDTGIFLIKKTHVLDHTHLLTISWIKIFKAGAFQGPNDV